MKTAPLKKTLRLLAAALLLFLLASSGYVAYQLTQPAPAPTTQPADLTEQTQPEPLSSPLPSATPQSIATLPIPIELQEQGAILLSLSDGYHQHLFAYHPQLFPLTRITNNAWDDLNPAISSDGTRIAYTSRRNGYWNLYLLDVTSGVQMQLSDTPGYEGSPSWSPDNQWLVYETWFNDNLELWLSNVNSPDQPIPLTDDPAPDFSPAWSPGGRQIAFISTRSGNADIWLADLNSNDQRFLNLTNSSDAQENHPVWSPDGRWLAWSSDKDGRRQIWLWQTDTDIKTARLLGRGDWPAFSPQGDILLTGIQDPNQTLLTAYQISDARIVLPPLPLPGQIAGLDWQRMSGNRQNLLLPQAIQPPQPIPYQPVLTLFPVAPLGRYGIVPIQDVNAPYPFLHDAADEAFIALRQLIAEQTGWDLLLNLENAYLPLTEPPTPSIYEDWLYTGRAIAFNPLAQQAGWMVVMREEFDGQTFWRVYLKARYQDGSQGIPLTQSPWDLNARFSGDPKAYEQGGRINPIPAGYWIDLTDLAQRSGWQRLPALRNWRSFYPAARFNQLAFTNGLSWSAAMAELYPPEALSTPTFIPTYTPTPIIPTPTATLRLARTHTPAPPTQTPTPIPSTTLRPTWTPPPPTAKP